eukprot:GHVO01032751.1.p1 GENE.GHVO01032751.1~~GHVO01032751.1.p1  ORF type:complete len:1264 (+),score=150.37 GHVO01032751.1:26-3793(+)
MNNPDFGQLCGFFENGNWGKDCSIMTCEECGGMRPVSDEISFGSYVRFVSRAMAQSKKSQASHQQPERSKSDDKLSGDENLAANFVRANTIDFAESETSTPVLLRRESAPACGTIYDNPYTVDDVGDPCEEMAPIMPLHVPQLGTECASTAMSGDTEEFRSFLARNESTNAQTLAGGEDFPRSSIRAELETPAIAGSSMNFLCLCPLRVESVERHQEGRDQEQTVNQQFTTLFDDSPKIRIDRLKQVRKRFFQDDSPKETHSPKPPCAIECIKSLKAPEPAYAPFSIKLRHSRSSNLTAHITARGFDVPGCAVELLWKISLSDLLCAAFDAASIPRKCGSSLKSEATVKSVFLAALDDEDVIMPPPQRRNDRVGSTPMPPSARLDILPRRTRRDSVDSRSSRKSWRSPQTSRSAVNGEGGRSPSYLRPLPRNKSLPSTCTSAADLYEHEVSTLVSTLKQGIRLPPNVLGTAYAQEKYPAIDAFTRNVLRLIRSEEIYDDAHPESPDDAPNKSSSWFSSFKRKIKRSLKPPQSTGVTGGKAAAGRDAWHPLYCEYPQVPYVFNTGNNIKDVFYSNGDRYRGEMLRRMRHGMGSYIHNKRSRGTRYDGQWLLSQKHGTGSLQYDDDSIYAGEWRNDEINGHGAFLYSTGALYEGSFVNGRSQGIGVYREPYGVTYFGGFSLGEKHGWGILLRASSNDSGVACDTALQIHDMGNMRYNLSLMDVWPDILSNVLCRYRGVVAGEEISSSSTEPLLPETWNVLDVQAWCKIIGLSHATCRTLLFAGACGCKLLNLIRFGSRKCRHMEPSTPNFKSPETLETLIPNRSERRVFAPFVLSLLKRQTRQMESRCLRNMTLFDESETTLFDQLTIDPNDLRMTEVIGEGGFARVWKGTWKDLPVAIKELSESDISAPQLRAFADEVRILAAAHHPNICNIMGICLPKMHPLERNRKRMTIKQLLKGPRSTEQRAALSSLLIVTELVEGGTLFDLIHGPDSPADPLKVTHPRNVPRPSVPKLSAERERANSSDLLRAMKVEERYQKAPRPDRRAPPIPLQLLLGVLTSVCSAVAHLHSKGIIHCDLKSCNVLLDKHRRTPKVCDFGLSLQKDFSGADSCRSINDRAVPEKNACGAYRTSSAKIGAVGTPHWSAPEVLRGLGHTEKSDVYAFGMIIYELLYRQLPYANLSVGQIYTVVGWGLGTPALPRGRHLYEWPKCLEVIMRLCLHPKPSARPTFEAIARALDHLEQSSSEMPLRAVENFLFG